MNKVAALLVVLFLSGCSIFQKPVPVKRTFPEVPQELTKMCMELMQIESNKTSITDMLKVVVHNYSLYYECSNRVEGWNDWYKEQKNIFDSVK